MKKFAYKCMPFPGVKFETLVEFFGKCVNNGDKIVLKNGYIFCDKNAWEWGYNLGILIGGYTVPIDALS